MTVVRAMVVGIDHYDYPGWSLSGPVAAAMRVARWLLALPGVALELHLFLSKGSILENELAAALEAGRLVFHEDTTHATIDTFTRTVLPRDVKAGAHLFVFWSGHGGTSRSAKDRVFMCSDFQEALEHRVFNASNFLQLARTAPFSAFASELLLADACGTYESLKVFQKEEHHEGDTPQLAYFASPEGGYANTEMAGGRFTDTALQVLGRAGAYPADVEALAGQLKSAFAAFDGPAFRLVTVGGRENSECIVGRSVVHAPSLPYLEEAMQLFEELDIVDDDYRIHYERTAAAMGFPTVPVAAGAQEVLAHLCDLRDGNVGQMPLGLMQFMLRLAQEKKFKAGIMGWFDRVAPGQRNSRAKVGKILHVERQRKVMLFIVGECRGEIHSLEPYLCRIDGSPNPDHTFPNGMRECRGWEQLVLAVQEILTEFCHNGRLPNLAVHFAVDTPLLDRPFHRIPLEPGGRPVSELAPVVLRHRSRILSHDSDWIENWTAYARMLRAKAPADLKWVEIGPVFPLPADQGMCFTGFSLPHPGDTGKSNQEEKQVLDQLLNLGAPVLYVRHMAPHDERYDLVCSTLEMVTADLKNFDAFAKVFFQHRQRGEVVASNASLLWDDPDTNPFTPSYGVSDE